MLQRNGHLQRVFQTTFWYLVISSFFKNLTENIFSLIPNLDTLFYPLIFILSVAHRFDFWKCFKIFSLLKTWPGIHLIVPLSFDSGARSTQLLVREGEREKLVVSEVKCPQKVRLLRISEIIFAIVWLKTRSVWWLSNEIDAFFQKASSPYCTVISNAWWTPQFQGQELRGWLHCEASKSSLLWECRSLY